MLLTIATIPVVLMALAALWFAVDSARDARAGHQFDRLRLDQGRPQVEALMGTPDVSRPCGESLWWGGDGDYRGRNDGRCVTEVRYEHFLSAWAVGYSSDGRVVSKYHYVSE